MRNRQGVTLVELLVAMVLLAVLLTSVAALTFEAARSSITVAGEQYRQGVTLEAVNRLTAVRFSSLPAGTTCQTTTTGTFPHTLCVRVASAGLYSKQVQVVVTPAQPGVRPDTVTFIRANPPMTNPLSM
jgi:prepilin-type N-terminal cleavage/methylation domain-containing protein